MSLIHLARQGFITKSALPNVTRQRGTTTGTANLMLYGAGKNFAIGTNTTFTDSSSNNFTVTRNGDTIQATNNPFTGSVYFDGNGDYLSNSTNNSSIAFGSGDFTLEFYIYNTSTATQVIYDTRINTGSNTGGFQIYRDSTTIYVYDTTGAGTLLASTSISTNVWTHFAIVRSGSATGNVKLYKDGVLASSSASANTTDYSQGYINIGCYQLGGVPSAFLFGYISNFRIVKGTAVYTANFTPPTSPLTAITNTQLLLLTAQQAPFRDSSSNNFTVTANGNAAGSGLEPFPVNYAGSAYFDGTGDDVTVPTNAAFNFGTGDFTVECWVYQTANSGVRGVLGTHATFFGGGWGFYIDTGGVVFQVFVNGTSNADTAGGPSTVALNTWTHIAAVRSSGNLTVYVNGVGGTAVTSTKNGDNTASFYLGVYEALLTNYRFTGYISNARVIKGTAQYTANFTPPAAPLTAVTNTSLLLLTNNVGPFVDTSANGFPVLRNGDAVQTGFSPFTGQPSAGSGYFDGTGDYLTVPNFSALQLTNSTAFTIECWVYPTNLTFPQKYILENFNPTSPFQGYGLAYNINSTNAVEWWDGGGTWANTGITLTTNEWTHIAVTYEGSGTTRRFFKNGVLSGSAGTVSSSINYTAGACSIGAQDTNTPWFGYISNLRIIKGTALYTSNFTPATAPLPAVPNTSLLLNTDNYTIANSTPTYLPVTVNGNTTISTAQYPTGMNRSIYFDGNGDYLQVPDNTAFAFGTGDFTVECFMWLDSTASPGRIDNNKTVTIFSTGNSSTNDSSFAILGNTTTAGTGFEFFQYATPFNIAFTVAVSIPTNTWNHIAYVRSGSNLYAFLNGVRYTLTTSLSASIGSSTAPKIGTANTTGYPNWFKGYLSNVRITKGSAIYTENFTAPTAPLSISVTVPNFVTNNVYGVYQLA